MNIQNYKTILTNSLDWLTSIQGGFFIISFALLLFAIDIFLLFNQYALWVINCSYVIFGLAIIITIFALIRCIKEEKKE